MLRLGTKPIHPRVEAALVADQGILESFGMTVGSARDGRCEISATVPAALVNAAGFAHGSVAFAIMDTACAYAITSLEVRGVTLSANTSYVKAAQPGSRLRGRVELASRTRSVATLRGEVFLVSAEGEALAAHGSFVFKLIDG